MSRSLFLPPLKSCSPPHSSSDSSSSSWALLLRAGSGFSFSKKAVAEFGDDERKERTVRSQDVGNKNWAKRTEREREEPPGALSLCAPSRQTLTHRQRPAGDRGKASADVTPGLGPPLLLAGWVGRCARAQKRAHLWPIAMPPTPPSKTSCCRRGVPREAPLTHWRRRICAPILTQQHWCARTKVARQVSRRI